MWLDPKLFTIIKCQEILSQICVQPPLPPSPSSLTCLSLPHTSKAYPPPTTGWGKQPDQRLSPYALYWPIESTHTPPSGFLKGLGITYKSGSLLNWPFQNTPLEYQGSRWPTWLSQQLAPYYEEPRGLGTYQAFPWQRIHQAAAAFSTDTYTIHA